ncbi:Gfo/Idh/MocA family oxidoreductase [Oscillospiraceae bacterium PP1C4]
MLKIGVVGTGGMGTVHLSNYAHIDDCKVVAICDMSPEAEKKAQELGVKLYTEIETMLCSEELDIVDVCTPTFMHKAHVLAALNTGKHVICEKPLALKHADAVEMMDLAEEKGVQLFVGQVLQYSREAAVLHALVKSGEYGKVLDASFMRLSACPRWIKNNWLFDITRSGHLPFDLHIHDLDLIVSLFGVPKTVNYTSCGNQDKDYKEHYRFIYGYEDKHIMAEAAWYNADIPFTATWRVYFENAVVVNDGIETVAYRFDHAPFTFDTKEKIKIPTGINIPPTGMFYDELTDFLGQIKKGGKGCSRREEILTVIKILEDINLANN